MAKERADPQDARPPLTVDECLFHRCQDHLYAPQINSNEFSGAECGACVEAYYEGIHTMVVGRLGGTVEGKPTERGNFLQRIDELRRIEKDYLWYADSAGAKGIRLKGHDPKEKEE